MLDEDADVDGVEAAGEDRPEDFFEGVSHLGTHYARCQRFVTRRVALRRVVRPSRNGSRATRSSLATLPFGSRPRARNGVALYTLGS
jgi:hypothetical protein